MEKPSVIYSRAATGYLVAAFEVRGYRPRDEDVYVIYSQPGQMLGRFALHGDRTLFLFVFTETERLSPIADLSAQKQSYVSGLMM
jgi:hypothetical protein